MLRLSSHLAVGLFRCRPHLSMKKLSAYLFFLFIVAAIGHARAFGQQGEYKSQEVAENDGIPVLIKHLPEWETVRGKAKLTDSIEEIKKELGSPDILNGIDLNGGAEAALAAYPAGRLLLIEYPTPQGSSSADVEIQARLGSAPNTVYRRVGNYNALVFNAADPVAANALLDKITYGKTVQWLGEDPFLLQKFERYIANTGRDVAISTVLFILGIFMTAICLGVGSGYAYFRFREQQRAHRTAFSDAGGLTRLNLDDLTD